MKTKLPILSKIPALFALGTLAITVVSCSSYQNSSYYDNDGVYGNYERNDNDVVNQYSEENIENGQAYAGEFRAMQAEYQDQYEYFTDVDNYASETENDTVVTVYNKNYDDNERYAGWGSNDHDVTINYYNSGWNNWYSPYWGYYNYSPYWYGGYYNNWYGSNWGWGWNSYYGPNWGWGWNSWYSPYYYGGYYNNWYHPYGYGYYGRNVAYSSGPRGGTPYYNSGRLSGRNNVNLNKPRSTYSNPRSSTQPRNSSNSSTPRPRSTYSNPRNNSSSTPRPRTNNYSTPKPRTNTSTPRSSTPRPRSSSYSTPRSSSGSFGGSRGGGSFGGSRSGGRR